MLEMDQMDFVCVKYRIDDTICSQSLLFVLLLRIFGIQPPALLEFCSSGEVN